MTRVYPEQFPKGYYWGQKNNGYPLSDVHRKNLDFMKDKVLNHRMDACFVYDGRTGEGKTTKALQDALYLDPTFNLSRVVFDPEETDRVLRTATKGQAVVIDEAIVFSSRSAMSEYNKKMIKVMTQIRSKHLFIFFVLPSIFDLDRSIALYRANMLIHLYSKSFGQRGTYCCWFQKNIKTLYLHGRKYYSYGKPKPNFYATFSRCFILDEKAYEKKKQAAVNRLMDSKSTKKNTFKIDRNHMIRRLREIHGWSYTEIAELVETIVPDTVGKIVRGDRGG